MRWNKPNAKLTRSMTYSIRKNTESRCFRCSAGTVKALHCSLPANILSDMFDRFGDDIRIKKITEDVFSVNVVVQTSKTFFAWVVGTQGKVKITSPQKTVDEFNAFVSKIKEAY